MLRRTHPQVIRGTSGSAEQIDDVRVSGDVVIVGSGTLRVLPHPSDARSWLDKSEKTLLSHTTIGVADVRTAQRFYGPVLEALGLTLKFADERWAGWKHPLAERPLFIITMPFDGNAASVGNGQMVAFLASSRLVVEKCYSLALELGGTGEGEPGLRPDYHPNYYGAYFRDPDGNKLCVCCHGAE